jgi:hypothetical protein
MAKKTRTSQAIVEAAMELFRRRRFAERQFAYGCSRAHATFRLWDRGWPLVAFTLRTRRIDKDLGAQLAEVDTMRRTPLWVICRRLDVEGRLRTPGAAEPAADVAFALSTPTVFEELVHVRGWPADHAAGTIAGIVVEAIVDPATPAVTDPPPDWGALGLGMRTPTD